MKSKVIILTCALFLLAASFVQGQEYRKYPFKSGKVEYKLEGNTKGTEVIYWDDYGMKEVNIEQSESKMFGQTTISNSTTLTLGSYVYEWNDEDERVYQTSNPIAESWEEGNYDDEDVEDFSIQTIEALGFEKIGTESVLGKKCDVYKGLGKIWVWKGLSLKTEVKVLGTKSIITATNISTNVRVPSSVFELPKIVKSSRMAT